MSPQLAVTLILILLFLNVYCLSSFSLVVLVLGWLLFEEPFWVLPLLEGEENVAFYSYVNTYIQYSYHFFVLVFVLDALFIAQCSLLFISSAFCDPAMFAIV